MPGAQPGGSGSRSGAEPSSAFGTPDAAATVVALPPPAARADKAAQQTALQQRVQALEAELKGWGFSLDVDTSTAERACTILHKTEVRSSKC